MNHGWLPAELGYCSNVHPGDSLDQVIDAIERWMSPVRDQRGLQHMAAGLWLSENSASALKNPANLDSFSALLEDRGISLITLNGFPYQGFHQPVVKQQVYQPDWSARERLDHTLDLATILAGFLPVKYAGTISSVPLGYATQWSDEKQQVAIDNLVDCLVGLQHLRQESGRQVRLCLEMEPDCVLQETHQLVEFLAHDIHPRIESRGLDKDLVANHLGVCFDICHQAVMFEDCYQSMSALHDHGIAIGKIQVSSALQLNDAADPAALAALQQFIEPRYLHQTVCMDSDGHIHRAPDLGQACAQFPREGRWRVHYHVPVQTESLLSEGLVTTHESIGQCLDFLADHPGLHPHIEVETYTWSALPATLRPDDDASLVAGIRGELDWLEQQMQARGLLREDLSSG